MQPRTRRNVAIAAVLGVAGAAAFVGYGVVTAADHVDSPFVTENQATDIADVYSFESPGNPDNLVLAMTVSGAQSPPEMLLGRSIFDRNTLYQFEIDSNGDAIEDFVIQGYVIGSPTNQQMEVVGPIAPSQTGNAARIVNQRGKPFRVDVSTDATPITVQRDDGLKAFAGLRDDPFFFDLAAFQGVVDAIVTGNGTPAFDDPGTDFFAGLNVYAFVVEVPIALLGGDASSLAVWGTTSQR